VVGFTFVGAAKDKEQLKKTVARRTSFITSDSMTSGLILARAKGIGEI
jgi:hypothetical protein